MNITIPSASLTTITLKKFVFPEPMDFASHMSKCGNQVKFWKEEPCRCGNRMIFPNWPITVEVTNGDPKLLMKKAQEVHPDVITEEENFDPEMRLSEMWPDDTCGCGEE